MFAVGMLIPVYFESQDMNRQSRVPGPGSAETNALATSRLS